MASGLALVLTGVRPWAREHTFGLQASVLLVLGAQAVVALLWLEAAAALVWARGPCERETADE